MNRGETERVGVMVIVENLKKQLGKLLLVTSTQRVDGKIDNNTIIISSHIFLWS